MASSTALGWGTALSFEEGKQFNHRHWQGCRTVAGEAGQQPAGAWGEHCLFCTEREGAQLTHGHPGVLSGGAAGR